MKQLTLLFLLITTPFFACSLPGVFDDNTGAKIPAQESKQLLKVNISGGLAGVSQELVVQSDGLVSFCDLFHYPFNKSMRFEVDFGENIEREIDSLITTNHFLDFADEYINTRIADSRFYEIIYTGQSASKTVITNNPDGPEDLVDILTAIHNFIRRVQEKAPGVGFSLSRGQMRVGENIDLELTIGNSSASPMDLGFGSAQQFDFEAIKIDENGSEVLLWNWAYDLGFLALVWSVRLEPGEQKTFGASWSGVGNNGNQLMGQVILRGILTARPGGVSKEIPLTISL